MATLHEFVVVVVVVIVNVIVIVVLTRNTWVMIYHIPGVVYIIKQLFHSMST